MQWCETDASGFVRGAKWQVMPSGGSLGMRAAYRGKPLEEAWGANLHRTTSKVFGRSFEWGIIAEDLPEEANRVVLDATLTDSDGIAAPKIVYRNTENTHRLLKFHLDRAQEAMAAAGAVTMSTTPLMCDCGRHLMGTARMGADAQTSVVNEWGQAHDVPNLYIHDGSVFVTSSGFNPTGTICAIAPRAVKHLIANRRDQKAAA